jgi:hypothetical protein
MPALIKKVNPARVNQILGLKNGFWGLELEMGLAVGVGS